jgi:Domain of unknown function (DUF4129)
MRRFTFNRPAVFLSALMLAALLAVLAGAAGRFNATWRPLPLIAICFVVALEAGFTYRNMRAQRLSIGERLRRVAPELLVLALVMRIAATLSAPEGSMIASLRIWLYDPLLAVDALFGLYMGAGLMVGLMANLSARDITTLEPSLSDAASLHADGHERYAAFLADERTTALRRLASRFATGGAILIMALSLEAVNMREVGGVARPISTMSIVAALVFLVCGFLLLSRARLALLQSRWQLEGATVAPSVARRWSSGSMLIIIAVLLLAALLPRAYGRELLETLGNLIGVIGYVLALIGYVIAWLFGMMLLIPAWLLSLLAPTSNDVIQAPPPAMAPPALPAETPALSPAFLFWVCVAVLITLALRTVLQRHPRLLRGLRVWLLRTWLRILSLLSGGARWVSLVATSVQELLAAQPEGGQAPPARPWIERLDPARRIARYYHTVVHAAAETGHPRQPGQTPREYRKQLGESIPETTGDFSDLTEAYVRVRYAPHPTTSQDAQRAKGLWQRLRRILRMTERGR